MAGKRRIVKKLDILGKEYFIEEVKINPFYWGRTGRIAPILRELEEAIENSKVHEVVKTL